MCVYEGWGGMGRGRKWLVELGGRCIGFMYIRFCNFSPQSWQDSDFCGKIMVSFILQFLASFPICPFLSKITGKREDIHPLLIMTLTTPPVVHRCETLRSTLFTLTLYHRLFPNPHLLSQASQKSRTAKAQTSMQVYPFSPAKA